MVLTSVFKDQTCMVYACDDKPSRLELNPRTMMWSTKNVYKHSIIDVHYKLLVQCDEKPER